MKLLDKLWSVLGLIETEETDLASGSEKSTVRTEQKVERKQAAIPSVTNSPRMVPAVSVTPVHGSSGNGAVVISHPVGFDDARQIAEHVTNSRTVVVNFDKTDSETTKRTVDFMSGITYAVGGVVQRISGNIFLFAPDRVEIVFGDTMNETERGSLPWTRRETKGGF